MHPMLNIAIRAARMAGNLLTRNYEIPETIETNSKISSDFVSKVDFNAKCLIIETIRKSYPHHTILSKESCNMLYSGNEIQWILNPLDGAANFIRRLPHFSVSLAVRIRGRTEIAVVYDPMRNEMFTATRGQGSQLNGYRLRGAISKYLAGTVLATCFKFKDKKQVPSYIVVLDKFFQQFTDLRYTGTPALDLAYVAAGRVDGFFALGLKPWNITAGELLVCEAGGLVTDFDGGHNYLKSGNTIAGNPRIVRAILGNVSNKLMKIKKIDISGKL
ncbi:inositol-1-monophosphatase [Candidatus Profftia tarda]|uniref:Inositol-1-monophosphatase n=1 Tax=Candidatus Profftia tarda TaxID=1177216 RepID=A0A8E4F0D5_9ENTR|nr:inositol-1-monophosphatase [Candidatus Profftia tarda]CAD6511368.1 Inositol-1-monophosphatase [Candidatus Profftia tarda]